MQLPSEGGGGGPISQVFLAQLLPRQWDVGHPAGAGPGHQHPRAGQEAAEPLYQG